MKKINRLAELEDFNPQATSPREPYIRHNRVHSKEFETKYGAEVKEIKESWMKAVSVHQAQQTDNLDYCSQIGYELLEEQVSDILSDVIELLL